MTTLITENRLAEMDARFTKIDRDLCVVKWMVGIVLALHLAIFILGAELVTRLIK